MRELTAPLPTKAAKIRALDKAGFARSDIARFLGIRYQHVRNVLTQKEPERPAPSQSTTGQAFENWRSLRLIVTEEGLTVPLGALRKLGLKPGDVALVRVEDEEFVGGSAATALRRAQDLMASLAPPDVCLSDSLIEDRRREVENERD